MFLFVSVHRVNPKHPQLNTTIWDQRISVSETNLYRKEKVKLNSLYPILDASGKLYNNTFDVYLNWDYEPIVGYIYKKSMKIGSFVTPSDFTKD